MKRERDKDGSPPPCCFAYRILITAMCRGNTRYRDEQRERRCMCYFNGVLYLLRFNDRDIKTRTVVPWEQNVVLCRECVGWRTYSSAGTALDVSGRDVKTKVQSVGRSLTVGPVSRVAVFQRWSAVSDGRAGVAYRDLVVR